MHEYAALCQGRPEPRRKRQGPSRHSVTAQGPPPLIRAQNLDLQGTSQAA
jgi:hypothetical protein